MSAADVVGTFVAWLLVGAAALLILAVVLAVAVGAFTVFGVTVAAVIDGVV